MHMLLFWGLFLLFMFFILSETAKVYMDCYTYPTPVLKDKINFKVFYKAQFF
jgi:hypothetical protein